MPKAFRQRSILLAGPHRDTREVIADCLETEGAHVFEATNRDEALLALRGQRFDALIIDLLLAGEGEVVRAAKASDPSLGVLVIGEAASSAARPQAGHLNKPFAREELLEAVRSLLPAPSKSQRSSQPAASPRSG